MARPSGGPLTKTGRYMFGFGPLDLREWPGAWLAYGGRAGVGAPAGSFLRRSVIPVRRWIRGITPAAYGVDEDGDEAVRGGGDMMTDDGRTARRYARRAPDLRCHAGTPRPAGGRGGAGEPAGQDVRTVDGLEVGVVVAGGGTAVAAVRGEIDLNTADVLRGWLAELQAAGHGNLVVDFAGVAFCDAAGLGALVAAHNRAAADGGALRLSRVRPAQRRLLRVTGLHRVFGLYDDIDGALAAAASSAR